MNRRNAHPAHFPVWKTLRVRLGIFSRLLAFFLGGSSGAFAESPFNDKTVAIQMGMASLFGNSVVWAVTEKDWTFLPYMVADNNLDHLAIA